jgi:DnaK suppressor protein
MEPEELEQLKQLLLARRAELLTQGTVDFEPNKLDPTDRPDDDAQPLNEMNQVIASKRNRARKLELDRIGAALQRIELAPDDFGECLTCGEPIKMRRLELMPWALNCVVCEDKKNPRKRHRRRHLTDYDE